jgi:hypothetical protein
MRERSPGVEPIPAQANVLVSEQVARRARRAGYQVKPEPMR